LAVLVCDNFAFCFSNADNVIAGGDVFFAVVTVACETGFAGAVVVFLTGDSLVGDAVGIDVTVVVLAWVDGFADFSGSVVADFAFADVVDVVADDCRLAVSVFVTSTVGGKAWIIWETFLAAVSGVTFTRVANAVFTGDAVGVCVAGTWNGAPVNGITSVVTVAREVLFADAVVTFGLVNALGVSMTCVGSRFAFVDWTNEGVVVPGEPQSPLGFVFGGALTVDVVSKSFNTGVEIGSIDNVVEVYQFAWNGTGLSVAFSTVSLSSRRCVVRSGLTEFLIVKFSVAE
jgi:hypothetical protein